MASYNLKDVDDKLWKEVKILELNKGGDYSGIDCRAFKESCQEKGGLIMAKTERVDRGVYRVENKGVKSEYVFIYKGKPVKDVKTAFKQACEDAGIPYGRYVANGITFHDLRHSYGSYLMEQGTNFRATQGLMRHENP